MLSLILAKKIFSLFIIMLMSMSLVRLKILKASDSKVMSILLLYLFFPCVIIDAFQVDFTPEIQHGLLLSTAAAVAVQALLLFAGLFWQRLLHLNAVEVCSVIYSNAGNLIIPLVIAVLGAEWVIYSSTFLAVQLVLFWTHMKSTMARETHMDWRAVFTNANMIAIFIGLVLLLTGWRLPGPVNDALHSLGLVIGPSAMIIAGMLLGNMSWEKIRSYKRVTLVAFLRLIVMPLIILVFVKYSGLAAFSPDGKTILLITLLATATPSATTCVSMASLFDNQPEYASVINVVTATLCTITMPLIVWLYQL
ncbi:AEC family transporter [uncultured Phascolarctobacterium sp.]|uniref:AEC family transporter n=1 Tax=uncultured Phascolarctobacterium sp. TaxID=512296 RepID=UPI0026139409|nr:AEC family transporter [uncultured Phascolarctobacterium sp.]